MKCQHEGCDGELQYNQEAEEKGRFGVFECNKCHCVFSLMNVRKNENCPSVKGKTKSLSTSDATVKRGRGRPKGSKNKVKA